MLSHRTESLELQGNPVTRSACERLRVGLRGPEADRGLKLIPLVWKRSPRGCILVSPSSLRRHLENSQDAAGRGLSFRPVSVVADVRMKWFELSPPCSYPATVTAANVCSALVGAQFGRLVSRCVCTGWACVRFFEML